jgi:hypothetical protein
MGEKHNDKLSGHMRRRSGSSQPRTRAGSWPPFHICLAVSDLEASMREVGAGLGLTWNDIEELTPAGVRIRRAYSIEGPPHLELVQGPEGSEWDGPNGSTLHHLAVWSQDVASDVSRLEAAGMKRVFPAKALFREGASGLRLEIVPVTHK